jgi:hypothetical protein
MTLFKSVLALKFLVSGNIRPPRRIGIHAAVQ